jgi:N-acetylglucosamine-6-phosphate deacetylase
MDKNSLLIRNVRIVLPGGIFDGEVLVEDGIIAVLGTDLSGGGAVYDGNGMYLAPGFIDIHNHGRLGVNVMDGDAALETIARDHLAHGVTGFLAGVSTAPWEKVLDSVAAAAAYCRRQRPDISRCFGVYSEATFFSVEKRGAHNPGWLLPPDGEKIGRLLDAGGDALRVAALSPELPGALEAIRRLRRLGVTVAAAHSNASYAEALAGINAGITLATHTFNGMRGLHHQEPGVLGAVLSDRRVICELIADGIHISPVILSIVCRLKGPSLTALVSDSVELNGLADGEYKVRERTVSVQNGAVRLADGRLAGSCLDLDRAVRGMTVFAGVPIWDAVSMASLVPARAAGLDARKGSIETGKDADFVLLDAGLAVREVFLGGAACGAGQPPARGRPA